MTKTLNISHSYNRRRHTTTERLLCFQADRLEKWIKIEKRMDSSTCSMTVTSSSVLGSHSPRYSTGPHSFSVSTFKTKTTTVQKFLLHSSMMCQGRHTCSPSRKPLLCRVTQCVLWELQIHSFLSMRGKAEFNLTVPQTCLKMLYQTT